MLLGASILVLEGIDTQLLANVAPVLLKDWAIDKIQLAPALAAHFLGMIVGSIAGGTLGDALGRRRMVLASRFSFGLLTCLAGAAASSGQMAALRFLSGLGFGALFPNMFSLIAEMTPAQQRARHVALATTGIPIGSMTGALVVGWILSLTGWRGCFLTAGAATLACGFIFSANLPESPAFLSEAARRAGYARGDEAAGPVRTRDGARALLLLFRADLRRRTLSLLTLSFAIGYVTNGFLLWGVTVLSSADIPVRIAVMTTAVLSLSSAFAPFVMAATMARYGSRASMLLAIALYIGASLMFGLALRGDLGGALEVRVAAVIVSLVVLGLAMGTSLSGLFALAAVCYPAECRASGSGMTNALNRLGAAVTAFGSAAVLQWSGSGATALTIVAAVTLLVSLVCTWLFDAHLPPRSREETDMPAD
jgi:AAHS family 4-hydroxybenzoate transporter-like MFS transporter